MPLGGCYWSQTSSPSHGSADFLVPWFLVSLYCWLKQTFYLFSEGKPSMCSDSPTSLPPPCSDRAEAGSPPTWCTLLCPVQMLPRKGSFFFYSSPSWWSDSVCGKSLNGHVQGSAALQRPAKHRDERRGARAFLSSLTAVKYTQAFPSKPSIIWPGVGAFAVQERYAEICQSLC